MLGDLLERWWFEVSIVLRSYGLHFGMYGRWVLLIVYTLLHPFTFQYAQYLCADAEMNGTNCLIGPYSDPDFLLRLLDLDGQTAVLVFQ